MINPRELYEAHRDAHFSFVGTWLPHWDEISWREKDKWQQTADELNEAEAEQDKAAAGLDLRADPFDVQDA